MKQIGVTYCTASSKEKSKEASNNLREREMNDKAFFRFCYPEEKEEEEEEEEVLQVAVLQIFSCSRLKTPLA